MAEFASSALAEEPKKKKHKKAAKFRRELAPQYTYGSDLAFQAMSWSGEDEEVDGETQYVIRAFGSTARGESVHAKITGFQPYCYIELPAGRHWTMSLCELIVDSVLRAMENWQRAKMAIVKKEIVQKRPFFGFTDKKPLRYLKLVFATYRSMRSILYQLKKPVNIFGKATRLRTCEAKLEPLLRFFHVREVHPCDWLALVGKQSVESTEATTQIDVTVPWDAVFPLDKDAHDPGQAPLLVASFDIECYSCDNGFPNPDRRSDKAMQIGMTYHWYRPCADWPEATLNADNTNRAPVHRRWIGVVGDAEGVVAEHGDVEVRCYKTEKGLLRGWVKLISRSDPDLLVGHNIFGFDYMYLWKRAELLGVTADMGKLHRVCGWDAKYREIKMSSGAYGDNCYRIIEMVGRSSVDSYKAIHREFKLASYKLDDVSVHFLGDDVRKIDLPAKEIFRRCVGNPAERGEVATYCVRDCEVVSSLVHKIDMITSNIGMSNVCDVPFTYLFTRGQGIKTRSLVSRECSKMNIVIRDLFAEEYPPSTFEGALVLDPVKGFHTEGVCVCDFASLYPSIMISENMSPDTLVDMSSGYAKLQDRYEYNTIEFNAPVLKSEKDAGNDGELEQEEPKKMTATFAAAKNGEKGVLPTILKSLLEARKITKKAMKNAKDPFKKKMFNSLQLAYKVSCNSVYGSLGARSSFMYAPETAAAVTAKGRWHLRHARDVILREYPGTKTAYGDTDSVFMIFPVDKGLSKREKIKKNIELGIEAAAKVTALLKPPMCLEYEKVLCPLLLVSRKRYTGNLYEFDPDKYVRKAMGLVTKRRDNAPIVKTLYNGILDILLDGDLDLIDPVVEAHKYFNNFMGSLISRNIEMEQLIISKTLRGTYKNPGGIAHCVLAKRMHERGDPNAPQVNDRVPYVFVVTESYNKMRKKKQGERIEDPTYAKTNNLDIDTIAYIDQLKTPVLQLLEFLTEDSKTWFDPFFIEARDEQDERYGTEAEKAEKVMKEWKSCPGLQIVKTCMQRQLVFRYPLAEGGTADMKLKQGGEDGICASKVTLKMVKAWYKTKTGISL